MPRHFRIILFLLLLAAAGRAGAQLPGSNGRQKTLKLRADSLQLDSLSIIPGSVHIAGLPDSAFSIDAPKGLLRWRQRPQGDSVHITYRVFPFRLTAVAQRLSYDSIRNFSYLRPFEFNTGKETESKGLFNFGNLQYNGSFGRGISFGNSQDAVVNSNFNLQLSGMLADSIEIAAAITDNNIPIQPDGTTQQLNEFDQVFLQFSKKNWKLNLGDIDLRQNNLYFLNFYKRLQGVTFQTNYGLGRDGKGSSLVSGSVAKGKFFRNIIDATSRPDLQLEGNQGPYRLRGANSEYFFIVLANSERVFLDGVLLQRGEDQDYVINYNTAEVTFTPKHLITKDSRIQIEFEYADRNFLNSNLYAYQTLDFGKKLSLKVGAFQNADAKNSSINQTLDDPQRRFLASIGDSVNQALYPNAVYDSFDRNRILYEKVYLTGGPVPDSFYRYSTDSLLARYSLSFTDLGAGQGNYVPDFNGANGKVYKYVAPVGGVKQGNFEPVIRLVTPKRQQVVSLAGDYRFNARNTLHAELGMSNYSANTFSTRDAADDRGLAGRLQFTNNTRLAAARGLELTTTVDLEHEQKQFRPLERLRYVEFTREWGLPLEQVDVPADETIARFSAALQDNRKHSFSYQLMSYRRNTDYRGLQQILQHNFVLGGWTFANALAVTSFYNSIDNGQFWRPVIDASRTLASLHNLKLGLRYSQEHNEVRNAATDTVTATSFSFDQWTAYLKTDEVRRNRYSLSFFTRSDKYPFEKGLTRGDRSYNTSVGAELLANEHHQVIVNASYRQLDVFNDKVSHQQKDRTFLGRVEYQINEFKGFVTGNTLYEVGSGQEQRRDISYYEVPAGKGEYAWNDYNGDGIQQLNEFEPAQFPDQARWIRIFIPTNDYIKANYTTLNYSFQFTPRNLFGNEKGRFIKRFTWQTALQKTKKGIAKGDVDFNPFKYNLQDTALLTAATALNNTVSFNRFSQKWGLDVSNLQNTGKSLLTYGYESRRLNDWLLKLRWNLSTSFTVNLNTKLGSNSLFTPSFNNRNYAIATQSAEPQLVYLHGSTFRLQAGYSFDQRRNEEQYGGEHSLTHSLNLDAKYSVLQNASVSSRFTFSSIEYPFAPNTTVSYIMLQGLLPGHNYLWSIDFTKRVLRNIEVNLQYEGRKAGESNTVHIGRASLRALF